MTNRSAASPTPVVPGHLRSDKSRRAALNRMMEVQRFCLRSRAELLDDAERYERWAERINGNPRIKQSFLALAREARAAANRTWS